MTDDTTTVRQERDQRGLEVGLTPDEVAQPRERPARSA